MLTRNRLCLFLLLVCNLALAAATNPLSGLGVTVHNEQVPTPTTPFPHEMWVRMDGRAPSVANRALDAADCAYWQGKGYKVLYNVPTNVIGTAGQVGHARDVQIIVRPDVIALGNEADINGVSHSAYSTAALAIRAAAFRYLTVQPFFVGPECANCRADDLAGPTSGLNYLTAVIADGGLAAFDGVSMHAYFNAAVDQPEVISGYVTTIQALIGGRPLIFTELGIDPTNAGLVLGLGHDATDAQRAGIYSRAAIAAGSVPFCFYDGPNTTPDGLCQWVNGAGSNAVTPLGSALNSNLQAAGFVGVGG